MFKSISLRFYQSTVFKQLNIHSRHMEQNARRTELVRSKLSDLVASHVKLVIALSGDTVNHGCGRECVSSSTVVPTQSGVRTCMKSAQECTHISWWPELRHLRQLCPVFVNTKAISVEDFHFIAHTAFLLSLPEVLHFIYLLFLSFQSKNTTGSLPEIVTRV